MPQTERLSLYFSGAEQVSLQAEPLPAPPAGQVQVRAGLSAVSPGTELLVYRGLLPADVPLDETIRALDGAPCYPLKYGYALVGQVTTLGAGVAPEWLGRRVFAFHPHESAFNARPDELLPIPDDISNEQAVFLPNTETAVNFLLDGAPLIGERVLVFGLGVVGLLTGALLAELPLGRLVGVDLYPQRRQTAVELGFHACLPADLPELPNRLLAALFNPASPPAGAYPGADLIYELSGAPAALDQAIAVCGFAGRIVVGSWYGRKPAVLNLGGRFHRARLHLISSQVSTLAPELSARWDSARRLQVAWEALRRLHPARLITHRLPLADAAGAYRRLTEQPGETLGVVFDYSLYNSGIPFRSETP